MIVSQTLLLDMKFQRTRREIQKYCNIKTEPSMSSKSAENKWDAGKESEREHGSLDALLANNQLYVRRGGTEEKKEQTC